MNAEDETTPATPTGDFYHDRHGHGYGTVRRPDPRIARDERSSHLRSQPEFTGSLRLVIGNV